MLNLLHTDSDWDRIVPIAMLLFVWDSSGTLQESRVQGEVPDSGLDHAVAMKESAAESMEHFERVVRTWFLRDLGDARE
jgi:hypothetical protein